jgi:hypothetical protein
MRETLAIASGEFSPLYETLWKTHDAHSFFRSPGHLRMISAVADCEIGYVVLSKGSQLIAALPFATKSSKLGRIINTLPFYGSCSSVVGSTLGDHAVLMVRKLLSHAKATGVSTVTIIDDWRHNVFSRLGDADFVSKRSNQFIELSRWRGSSPIDHYHHKTRNLVRKAAKLGVVGRISEDLKDFANLEAVHRENMASVGGAAKPARFFEWLRENPQGLARHRLYVASLDGWDCAYLLNFYCGDTVEYYMPAVRVDARSAQPLSLLIDVALQDAMRDGYSYWNFGGTWPNQHTLRHFKTRWGGEESSYSYYTYVINPEILSCSSKELLSEFSYFFVVPFDRLNEQAFVGTRQ